MVISLLGSDQSACRLAAVDAGGMPGAWRATIVEGV